MAKKQMYSEAALAELAKQFRLKSGKTKAEAARELGVTRPTMQLAEENPEQSLTKLRIRIIETYTLYRVAGPAYWLERK